MTRKESTGRNCIEPREALRLNLNDAAAHNNLGACPECKHNLREALQVYCAAYDLNPQNPDYRKTYECLAKKTSP